MEILGLNVMEVLPLRKLSEAGYSPVPPCKPSELTHHHYLGLGNLMLDRESQSFENDNW